jgi:hypothetical protein
VCEQEFGEHTHAGAHFEHYTGLRCALQAVGDTRSYAVIFEKMLSVRLFSLHQPLFERE